MREYRKRRKANQGHPLLAAKPPDPSRYESETITAEVIINWIETKLIVPTGRLAGQPFKVDAFQREWLEGALEQGIQEAGMSIARKNGKSGFIAAIILCGLCGPLNKNHWRCIVTSLTGKLAQELQDAIMLTAEASNVVHMINLKKSPPPGIIFGNNNSRADFLAADKATGHAVGCDLALIDEAGLLEENQRALWNALFTSISGRDGMFWCISIQGHSPMFQEMKERADSPRVYFREWVGDLECELDDREAWNAANPGLASGIKSITYMEGACERAQQLQANEMHFRAYDLNQPVDPERETIVSPALYRVVAQKPQPERKGNCIVGIDLGGSSSMTAAAIYWPDTGRLEVRGAFGDDPPLEKRARLDRMGSQYHVMLQEGSLKLYPGKVTPVVPFLSKLFEDIGQHSIVKSIGCDRYRKAEAEMAFQSAAIPYVKVHWRGMGASKFADGSRDIRNFQKAVLSGKLKPGDGTMLKVSIANSVLRYDPSGNPALNKATDASRIDPLSAAVIAVGIGEEALEDEEEEVFHFVL